MIIDVNAQDEKPDINNGIVCYLDYLGLSRTGKIVYMEPYDEINGIYWCYIQDMENEEFNDKLFDENGRRLYYSELRLSTDLYLEKIGEED